MKYDRKHHVAIQKEINRIKKQRDEAIERMYELGLSPFRGYYEKLLTQKNRETS
jgi:hypothetical protein